MHIMNAFECSLKCPTVALWAISVLLLLLFHNFRNFETWQQQQTATTIMHEKYAQICGNRHFEISQTRMTADAWQTAWTHTTATCCFWPFEMDYSKAREKFVWKRNYKIYALYNNNNKNKQSNQLSSKTITTVASLILLYCCSCCCQCCLVSEESWHRCYNNVCCLLLLLLRLIAQRLVNV